MNIYAPAIFAIKKDPNVVNGSRHLFNIIKNAREYLVIKDEFDGFMTTILNNSYFLLQEHVTLGLLSDTRISKRKLGKKIILKARRQQPEINGVRSFTKIEKIEDINIFTNDYSTFLNLEKIHVVCLTFSVFLICLGRL